MGRQASQRAPNPGDRGNKNLQEYNREIATEKAVDALNNIPSQDFYESRQMSGKNFQFPAKLGQGDTNSRGENDLLNWMLFTPYKISGGFSDTKQIQFRRTPGPTVALPIPPGITATYEQNWNQTNVPVTAQAITRGINQSAGLTNFIRGLAGTGVGAAADEFAGMDMGAEGLGATLQRTGLAEVTQFTAGARALDQVMMSYGGPAYRNFSYTYSLKPNNVEDTNMVENIIKWFKYKSAPGAADTFYTRLYRLPSVFEIQFYTGSEINPYLPRIGKCALTNITASYGGDIFRTFEGTRAPVQVNLALTFKEMELLDRDNMIGDDY